MATKSRRELLDIVAGSSGQYTEEAREAAQAELADRPAGDDDLDDVLDERAAEPRKAIDVVRWFLSAVLLFAGWILACLVPVISVSFLSRPSLSPRVFDTAAKCGAISLICLALARLLNPRWPLLLGKIAATVGVLALLLLIADASRSKTGIAPEFLTATIVSFVTAVALWLSHERFFTN